MVNKNYIFAGLIIIVGVAARLINITQPLLEMTMWRQCETAAIARNFYYNGMNIFYPQVLWGGGTEGYIGQTEFHLYPFVVALLYKVFGVHDYLGRLVSVFAFAGAAFFLYKLARKYIGAQGALVTLLFYTFNPHIFFFSRAFQPESSMLFFSITLIYFFSQWLDTEKRQYFILMILCGACAFLVKILTVCLGLPLLYLCIVKYRWKFFLEWRLWVFAFVTLSVTALWYTHSYKLGALNGLSWGTFHIGTRDGGVVGWSFLTGSYFYERVFYVYIFQRHLIYVGAILTVAGMFFAIRKKELHLFHFWILSQIVLYCIAAETSRNHSYYTMPIVVPSSIFIGWVIVTYFDRIKRCKLAQLPGPEKYLVVPFFILMIIVLPFICFHKITAKYKPERLQKDMSIYIAGNKVRELSPKDALVITAHWGGPELLYYCDRKGWVMESGRCSIESIEDRKKSGATWFVTTRVVEIDKKVILYLQNNYDVIESTDRYLIVKL